MFLMLINVTGFPDENIKLGQILWVWHATRYKLISLILSWYQWLYSVICIKSTCGTPAEIYFATILKYIWPQPCFFFSFITYRSCKHLDKKHTVFGRVVGGMETLSAVEAIGTDNQVKELQVLPNGLWVPFWMCAIEIRGSWDWAVGLLNNSISKAYLD